MKLTKAQTGMVDRLKGERERFDTAKAELDREHLQAIDQVKNSIRERVAEAEELGLPKRQIHLALGFGQVGQLVNFLKPKNGGERPVRLADYSEGPPKIAVGETVQVPVRNSWDEYPVRVVKIHPQTWEVYGTDGELWKRINLGNADQVWVASFDEEVPDEIRDALIEATGHKPIIANIRIGDEPIREEQWGEFV